MVAARPHVAERNRLVSRQLALQVYGVLLHSGRRAVLIDVADIPTDAGPRAERVAQGLHEAVGERVGDRDRRGRASGTLRTNRILRVAHLTVVVRRGVGDGVVERRPVDAVPAAHHGPRIDRVHRTDARRRLGLRRIALRRLVAADARVHEAAGDGPRRRPGRGIGRNRHGVAAGSNPTVKLLRSSCSPSSCSRRRP